MKVTCILCDTEKELEDKSVMAKQLINHPIKVYLCTTCHTKIKDKTEQTKSSQNGDNG